MATILVVDDDSTSQRILSYTLRKVGYKVLIAANGQAGLELLQHNSVQLAIIDLVMPVMSGIELLKCIRANQELCQIPILILTASGEEEEGREIAQQFGANGFLTKPSSSNAIIELVRKMIRDE